MANETPDYFYTRSNPPTASDVGALPLDGSVPMSAATLKLHGDYARWIHYENITALQVLEVAGDNSTRRQLMLSGNLTYPMEKALRVQDTVNGVNTAYNIYGEHNITCGTSDITAGTSALSTGCYYDVYK